MTEAERGVVGKVVASDGERNPEIQAAVNHRALLRAAGDKQLDNACGSDRYWGLPGNPGAVEVNGVLYTPATPSA